MGIFGDNNIKVIWFDEQINSDENKYYFTKLKTIFSKSEKYQLLDDGFNNFYKNNNENDFKIIIVIVSGRLFGRYIKKLKDNINKIINIPYTYIFTSIHYKKLLLKIKPDEEHILSYDTMITVNNGFYNPGGIYDNFDKLLNEMKILKEKIMSNIKIEPRRRDKINYEGILTFEYLESEEDLLAPALYKDIITNEEITKEDYTKFHSFILSFNSRELNTLIKNLDLFKNIPFEILSKYWVRCYTIESDFYKNLNNSLMKSKLPFNYKTFIKMLYKGVEINSLKSYQGKYLFRGSTINKIEIENINKYKNIGKLSNIVVFSKAFLSFSENRVKAESFCGVDINDDTKIGCLYILENNNINLHESNADIQNFSVFPEEKEILFFPGSSFIITNMKDINHKKIEIKLNYNGKFKEKFSLIFEDQKKINNLIYNNELTKNISGKELSFLKNGKYLKGEVIGKGTFGRIFKGKDLETDEIVAIKQIEKPKYKKALKYIIGEVKNSKKISQKIKYSCKFKDYFETKKYFNIVLSYYDDDLRNYFRKKGRFPPNLIKKIFKQLNEVFKELLNNRIAHRDIKPENILINYSNEEKTNFDSALSDYGLSKEYDEDGLMDSYVGSPIFMAPEVLNCYKKFHNNVYKNNCDLYNWDNNISFIFWKFSFSSKIF